MAARVHVLDTDDDAGPCEDIIVLARTHSGPCEDKIVPAKTHSGASEDTYCGSDDDEIYIFFFNIFLYKNIEYF